MLLILTYCAHEKTDASFYTKLWLDYYVYYRGFIKTVLKPFLLC